MPWVTKWSGEHIAPEDQPVGMWDGKVLDFRDPLPGDRDDNGILWFRDGVGQTGEPLFKTVHTARQRRAMARPCCQVCGKVLPTEDIPWLFDAADWAVVDAMPMTGTPPTCEDCWPVAEDACPHLRAKGPVRAIVGSIEPWGVWGEIYPPEGPPVHGSVAYHETDKLRRTVAKQALVTLVGARRAGANIPYLPEADR